MSLRALLKGTLNIMAPFHLSKYLQTLRPPSEKLIQPLQEAPSEIGLFHIHFYYRERYLRYLLSYEIEAQCYITTYRDSKMVKKKNLYDR